MSLADEENVQPLLSEQSVITGEPITEEERMGETPGTTEEREPKVDPENPDLNPDLNPDVDPDINPNVDPNVDPDRPQPPAPEEPTTDG